ncbi:MAG TPA: hypothetical protein PKM12_04065 [Marmoricola sp.]|nr:hypothetical protein [Marmoricola sp.]HNI71558.1 hypothetical protein [Marmoricola sp.]HNN48119.1 hypothetical protein [Marmoricola sp.]
MANRVILHIGLMKSGTTFVQGRLDANRDLLTAQGICFPGETWTDQVWGIGEFFGFERALPPQPGAWPALIREINEHPGTALISMEFLSPVVRPNIERFVAEFTNAEVRVVATVRDLGRNVPAMWQESLKNRYTFTWPEYVEGVRDRQGAAGKHFWRQHATATILQRWSEYVSAVSLVTVPHGGGSEVLWDRFAQACGISPEPWRQGSFPNASIGAIAAAYLLRLNQTSDSLTWPEYNLEVKNKLLRGPLTAYRAQDHSIGFTVEPWLLDKYHFQHGRLMELVANGMEVIGDLDELRPVDVAGIDPTQVTDSEIEHLGRFIEATQAGSPD